MELRTTGMDNSIEINFGCDIFIAGETEHYITWDQLTDKEKAKLCEIFLNLEKQLERFKVRLEET